MSNVVLYQCQETQRRKETDMGYYFNKPNHFEATPEEKDNAATLRKDLIGRVDTCELPDEVGYMIKWMICRVSEEAIVRKQRKAEVERWFEDVILQLDSGTTFTQYGLLEKFNATTKVRNYAQTVLSEWASNHHLIKYTSQYSRDLMATSVPVNVYEVL